MMPFLIFYSFLLHSAVTPLYSTQTQNLLEHRDGVLTDWLTYHDHLQQRDKEVMNRDEYDRKYAHESEDKAGHEESGFVSTAFKHMQQKYSALVCQKLASTELPMVLCSLIAAYVDVQWRHKEPLKVFSNGIFNLSFVSDSLMCAYGASGDQACIIDQETGKLVKKVPRDQMFSRTVPSTFSLPGDSFIDFDETADKMKKVIIDSSGQIVLVKSHLPFFEARLRGKECILRPRRWGSSFVNVRFSPDGHYIVAGATDGKVSIIDSATNKTLLALSHPAPVTALAINADGNALLVGLHNGGIYRWEGLFFRDMYASAAIAPQAAISGALPPAPIQMSDVSESDPVASRQISLPYGQRTWLYCLSDYIACCDHSRNCWNLCCSCIRTIGSCATNCPCCCAYGCYRSCECLTRACYFQLRCHRLLDWIG